MFQLNLPMDFGPGEEIYKTTEHSLYLSKIFRQEGLLKQCKLSVSHYPSSSLIWDYTFCVSDPTQIDIPVGTHNILAYKSCFISSCTATL